MSDSLNTEKTNTRENNDEEEFIERCSCGHDRHHHMVSAIPSYTAWGQFWVIFMGVSANPIRMDFQCRVCKEKFDFTIDPEELKEFL